MKLTKYQQAMLKVVLEQRLKNTKEALKDAPLIMSGAFEHDISFCSEILRNVEEAELED